MTLLLHRNARSIDRLGKCRRRKRQLLLILMTASLCSGAVAAQDRETQARVALEISAQARVDDFVTDVRASGLSTFAPVAVVVRTTPDLTHLDRGNRTILVPLWHELDPATRAVFAQRAGGDQAGHRMFERLVQQFLVIQQAAFLLTSGGADAYRDEADAKALAVAYWRRQPEGEAFLSDLLPRVVRAFQHTPDPVPGETTPSVYFNRQYATFRREPMPCGWFRLRFILNALVARPQVELATRVGHPWRGERGTHAVPSIATTADAAEVALDARP